MIKLAVKHTAEYFYFIFKGFFGAYYFGVGEKYNIRVSA